MLYHLLSFLAVVVFKYIFFHLKLINDQINDQVKESPSFTLCPYSQEDTYTVSIEKGLINW
jgi:hypothetical protein